jgi:hypothetical protein
MAAQGTVTVDFGATPVDGATFNFTDAALIGLTYMEPFIMRDDSTGDNSADAHQQLSARSKLCAGTPNGSGNVNVEAEVFIGFVTGTFKLRYAAN